MFFDSTLRDGNHAIKHQITANTIANYCRAVDDAGLYTVIVGHGNGAGASSLQTGISLLDDNVMLSVARANLKHTKLGIFLIPGYGTIEDNITPALALGTDVVCVGIHCTEANVARQHIQYVRSHGKEAYGILMMYHMATPERLVEEALKLQEYGALGVTLMDSAGASTPNMVRKAVTVLRTKLDINVGFHAHNNLGAAVGNSYIALECGAKIMDACVCGFGAGAGNCQLEALCALLKKEGIQTGLDLYKLLDASEQIIAPIWSDGKAQTVLSIISGMSGVFSSFATHVANAAKRFNIDPRDIFIELGNRKVVGGQEDMVVDVAMNLAQMKSKDSRDSFLESLL
jgi:4-hydroxy 2-oxovalerate aldolase